MTVTEPFETLTEEYDAWYDQHAGAHRAELAALDRAFPADDDIDRAIEIGVGTGRFAGELGIPIGVDPARSPLDRARDRGVTPVRGVAESLPIADDRLDLALVVTVLSFVDDLEATLSELHRTLAADGRLVVAVLDRSSPMGQVYQEHKDENPFYAEAEFLTGDEAADLLTEAGFEIDDRYQTVFDDPAEIDPETPADADVRSGHGNGLFAVIGATPAE